MYYAAKIVMHLYKAERTAWMWTLIWIWVGLWKVAPSRATTVGRMYAGLVRWYRQGGIACSVPPVEGTQGGGGKMYCEHVVSLLYLKGLAVFFARYWSYDILQNVLIARRSGVSPTGDCTWSDYIAIKHWFQSIQINVKIKQPISVLFLYG